MRISITTNDGILLETVEDVEQFDLDNPLALAALTQEIMDAIRRAKETAEEAAR